jgi:integrase
MKPRTVDTKTRFQSVYARHQLSCEVAVGGERCDCIPSHWGAVWDRENRQHRKTKFFRLATEARAARADLLEAVRKGKLPTESGVQFEEAVEKFLEAVREGVALSKRGRSYKPKSRVSLEDALGRVPISMSRKAVDRVTRGDVQTLIDDLHREGLSSSRIGAVVNAIRSFYHWALLRELATENPAGHVSLPAKSEKRRDRIATPTEFATLLKAIARQTSEERKEGHPRDQREALRDSVPYALAGYASARHQEIQILDWKDVDFKLDAIELAADEEGRKPGGSWRIVPMVAPLRAVMREEWLAQGRPKIGRVCPPRRNIKTGRVALNRVHQKTQGRWRDLGLEPIGFHDLRHTLATWLDHAGVSPKVSSEIMGHRTPTYRTPGAARITQDRYTHVLPGELERAREQLDEFLKERMEEEVRISPKR